MTNVAYPDFIVDDSRLIDAYADLPDFVTFEDMFEIFDALEQLNYRQRWAALLVKGNADRTDFLHSPVRVGFFKLSVL